MSRMRIARSTVYLALVLAVSACGGSAPPAASPTTPSPRTPSSPATTTSRSTLTQPIATVPAAATLAAPNHFVYVLGDSVLLGAKYTLPAALPRWTVRMNCVGSRRLVQGIDVLRARTWRRGDTVVIDLGNNYIPGEGGTFASQIDRAMRAVRVVRRVVWVTVAEKWPSRVTINRAIRAARYRWPTIRVADWAPVVAAHPSYAYDMLHLSSAGRLAIAKLIATKVRAT